MRNFSMICMLILAFTFSSFAQSGVTVLLKGAVRDAKTGSAVGTEYEIYDMQGSKVASARSNSSNGNYSATLKPGARYKIVFSGFTILKHIEEFDLQPSQSYAEINRDFTVQKLSTGMEMYAMAGFAVDGAALTPQASSILGELNTILKKNRGLNLVISLYPDMAPPRPAAPAPAAKVQSSNKKGKTPEPPPPPVATGPERKAVDATLTAQRIDAIRALLPDVKNIESRIKFVTDKSATPQQDAQNITLVISAGEVKNMFD